MKITLTSIIILLIPLAFSYGQQQDSLIIDSIYVEQGQTLVPLSTYGVTFDSVYSYALHLRCNAPLGGVWLLGPLFYFPPLTTWDERLDSLLQDHSIRMLGTANLGGDPHPPVFTNGSRAPLWTFAVSIPPDVPPQVVTIDTVSSFSFGNNSAFRRGYVIIGPATGIDEGGDRTPHDFSLLQNYPNPFNAQTTISYSLSQAGPVALSIYNIMGQQVATLVDEMQSAGEHRVVWDAKDVASGVYFGRLESGTKNKIIRMILLR